MRKARLNSFFAGIGGFEKAFEDAGAESAFFCERDPFCRSVLKRHWPAVEDAIDIESVDPEQLPKAEIWTAGFPCQDVSVARGWLGREGLQGKRTGLFYSFLKLVEANRPEVVMLENVTGLLNSHAGQDFAIILQSLTALGYGVSWRVLNARYFGSPQSRPRVFICAWYRQVGLAIDSLFEPSATKPAGKERAGFLTPCKSAESGAIVPEVAYCLAATSGRHTGTDWSRSYVSYWNEVRRLTPVECEALQGFSSNWTLPGPEFTQPADDIDTLRYHALGNAVCVPVMRWIAKRIISNLARKRGRLESRTAMQLTQAMNLRFMKKPTIEDLSEDRTSIKWFSGGCAAESAVVQGPSSPAPSKPIFKKLIDIIESGSIDKRYYLSANAAAGILRRVNGQGRTLFKPLHGALTRLAGAGSSEFAQDLRTTFSESTTCQTSSLFD